MGAPDRDRVDEAAHEVAPLRPKNPVLAAKWQHPRCCRLTGCTGEPIHLQAGAHQHAVRSQNAVVNENDARRRTALDPAGAGRCAHLTAAAPDVGGQRSRNRTEVNYRCTRRLKRRDAGDVRLNDAQFPVVEHLELPGTLSPERADALRASAGSSSSVVATTTFPHSS